MTSAATSNIDFGERTKLAVTLLNAERFAECKRELTTLLGYPELPRYYRIKCHIVRAKCQENWYDAEVCCNDDLIGESDQEMVEEMAEPGLFEFEAGQEEEKHKSGEA